MTWKEIRNLRRLASFANCIGKLSKGRSTQYSRYGATATTNYGRVTCVTKGVRPRMFVVNGSDVVENDVKYTYRDLIDRFVGDIVG
jgi:hypothetical protein